MEPPSGFGWAAGGGGEEGGRFRWGEGEGEAALFGVVVGLVRGWKSDIDTGCCPLLVDVRVSLLDYTLFNTFLSP